MAIEMRRIDRERIELHAFRKCLSRAKVAHRAVWQRVAVDYRVVVELRPALEPPR